MFRVDGALVPLKGGERITPDAVQQMAHGIMNPVQRQRFEDTREVDLAYGIPGLGRFRVNVFQQRGTVGIVFRAIPFGVKTIEQLVLPKIIESIAMEHRGLVLVTGTTGSGKSTTLAAMIDYINSNRTCHIMTIEDPIEFLIRDPRSIVNQREIGVDTHSFANPLRDALRQEPDVILASGVRECISDKDRTKEIHDASSKGFTTYGMQSFGQSLMQHVKAGLVTYEEALNHVSNADDFALRFRGIESASDATWEQFQEGDAGPRS